MGKTKIEWLRESSGYPDYILGALGYVFNPWKGCVEVGPGCLNCYAKVGSARNLQFPIAERGDTVPPSLWGPHAPRLISGDAYWNDPYTWNRKAQREGVRAKVFCGSMCDVMEGRDDIDLDSSRERLYKLIEATPNLDWLLLTKRPENFKYFLPKTWLQNPRPNVWLMTSCENQKYIDLRVSELLSVPAVVYGLSVEPMLGDVVLPPEFVRLKRQGWVIAGGESGHTKDVRPTPIEWFRSLRDQCISADVPFFFKQWGEHLDLIHIGKKAAGRLLDEREWNEYPGPAPVEYVDRREEILHNAASSDPVK